MNKNPFDLNNKTILVTGSTAGIGKAIALGCSNMGANVIVTGRNLSRLEETFSDLQLEKIINIFWQIYLMMKIWII